MTQSLTPTFDRDVASRLVGKYVLLGLTIEDSAGKIICREQCHGVVLSADPTAGVEIALKGMRLGQSKRFPPDTKIFTPAPPGKYSLHTTGETVVDPDFTATWFIRRHSERPRPSWRDFPRLLWERFVELPKGLRLTAMMNVVHAMIVSMILFAPGGLDGAAEALGEILLAVIVAFALLRPVKYALRIALFVTIGTLIGEIYLIQGALDYFPRSDAQVYSVGVHALSIVPLVLALMGLLPSLSRESMRRS